MMTVSFPIEFYAMRFDLPAPRRVSDLLFAIVLCLVTLSLAGQCSKYLWGHPKLKGFVPAFYLDYESTVPTWYSSAALGFAAVLLCFIALEKYRRGDRYRRSWAGLAGLLLLLSVDEIATFHEMPIDPLRESLDAGGLLYFTWVLPGIVAVVAVACLYWAFFLHLPRRTQALFFGAAAIFVSGAIGVEMLSGAQADQYGEENLTYALIITIEEFLEMAGVVILIRALVEYIHIHLGGLQIGLQQGAREG